MYRFTRTSIALCCFLFCIILGVWFGQPGPGFVVGLIWGAMVITVGPGRR